MKLRIKGDSIRIRLSKSEVEKVSKGEEVSSSLNLPNQSVLTYQVRSEELDEEKKMSVLFHDGTLTLILNKKAASDWYDNEIIGYEDSVYLPHQESKLSLLLEKDFKCLTERPGENESDNYEHPLDHH